MKQFSEEDVLNQLQIQLKCYYQENSTLRNPTLDDEQSEQDLASCFVNVTLIEEKVGRFAPPTDNKSTKEKNLADQQIFHDARLHSYEHIFNVRESLSLHELFKPGEDTRNTIPKQLVVAGQAGVGKTVFCQYLALAWAGLKDIDGSEKTHISDMARARFMQVSQMLSKFTFVFVIRLRELLNHQWEKQPTDWHTFGQIILDYCFTPSQKNDWLFDYSLEALISCLRNHRQHTLLILDGYDEIAAASEAQSFLKAFINFLLDKNHPWKLIQTSRPIASQSLKGDRRLELVGFLDADIQEFIRRRADKQEDAAAFINYLKTNPSIWGTAHNPLTLSLLCHLWKDSHSQLPSNKDLTLTRIYDAIIIFCARKYLVKQNKINDDEDKRLSDEEFLKQAATEIAFLSYLAFQTYKTTLRDSSIILTNQWVYDQKKAFEISHGSIVINLDAVCQFGLLSPTDRTKKTNKTDFCFSHLTFQEFFAARFMAHALWQGEGDKAIDVLSLVNQEKYTPQFYMVWQFLSGLLHDPYRKNEFDIDEKQTKKAIRRFWNAIEQAPRALHPIHHRCLTIRLLNEVINEQALDERRQPLNRKWNWIRAGVTVMVNELEQKIAPYHDDILKHPLFIALYRHPKNIRNLGLIQLIKDQIVSKPGYYISTTCVTALGMLAPHLEAGERVSLVQSHIQLFAKCKYTVFRKKTFTLLGLLCPQMDQKDRTLIIQTLQQELVPHNDEELLTSIIEILGTLVLQLDIEEGLSLIQMLIRILENGKYWKSREQAAGVLGKLGPQLESNSRALVIQALIQRLEKDNDNFLIAQAVKTLIAKCPLGLGEAALVVQTLRKRLENEKESKELDCVLKALSLVPELSVHDRALIVGAIIHELATNSLGRRRIGVAEAASSLGPQMNSEERESIIKVLIQLLEKDDDEYVQKEATIALGTLAVQQEMEPNDSLLQVLHQHLEKDKNSSVCVEAARALGKLGFKMNSKWRAIIIQAIIKRLETDEDGYVHEHVSNALSTFGPYMNPTERSWAVQALTQKLDQNQHYTALSILGPYLDQKELALLVHDVREQLKQHKNGYVIIYAAGFLDAMKFHISLKERSSFFEALLHRLEQDQDHELRGLMAEALGDLGHLMDQEIRNSVILGLTRAVEEDNNLLVRALASKALICLGSELSLIKYNSVLMALIHRFEQEKDDYGRGQTLKSLHPLGLYFLPSYFSVFVHNPSETSLNIYKGIRSKTEHHHHTLSLWHTNYLWSVSSKGLHYHGPEKSFFSWSSETAFKTGLVELRDEVRTYTESLSNEYCPADYFDCLLLNTTTLLYPVKHSVPTRTILYFAASHPLSELPLDHEKEIRPLSQLFHHHKYFKLISNLDDTEPATQCSLPEGVIKGSLQQLKNILAYLTSQQQPLWMIHLSMHGRVKEDNSDNQLCFVNTEGDDWVDSTTVNHDISGCHPLPIALLLISACESKKDILTKTLTCADEIIGTEDHEPSFEYAIRWAWEFYQLLAHQAKPVQINPTTFQEDINNRAKQGLLQACKLQFFCAPTSRTNRSSEAKDHEQHLHIDLIASGTETGDLDLTLAPRK